MTKYNIILVFFIVLFSSSCGDFTDLEGNLENPNEVNPSQLDPNLLLNNIQLEFGDFFYEASETGMELTRMFAMTGGDAYTRAYQPQNHDEIWGRGYQDVINQIDKLLIAVEGKSLFIHAGSAKVMKAYTLLTLVDLFGDVPYSTALKGDIGEFDPTIDKGKDVYEAAIKLLDEAIADLAKPALSKPTRDIYYNSDAAKWSALARTLKLKSYVNMRVSEAPNNAEISKLLGEDLVDTGAENFTYKYGTSDVPSRSRQPYYRLMYDPVEGSAGGYLGNFFLKTAYDAKGIEDPRWRYYFSRQIGSLDKGLEVDPESLPCGLTPRPNHYTPDMPYCSFDPGFYGRDHGNNDGTPPDSRAITTIGVYPFGGRVDDITSPTTESVTKQGQGANGAGIEPIWMSSFTSFLRAEALLILDNDAPGAKNAMVDGVQKSIAQVQSFGASKGQVPTAPVTPTADYVDVVSTKFDVSPDKLNIIMTEYYIALFGNGVEAYNMYRRTGKPANMQLMRAVSPGSFQRSLVYPSDFVNLNINATQKSFTDLPRVFWDNNPIDFVK